MSTVEATRKRAKTGGRIAGTPNKVTATAKAAIEEAFQRLGDVDGLMNWAQSDPDNLKAFYVSIWPKVIPLQVAGADGGNLTITINKPGA